MKAKLYTLEVRQCDFCPHSVWDITTGYKPLCTLAERLLPTRLNKRGIDVLCRIPKWCPLPDAPEEGK